MSCLQVSVLCGQASWRAVFCCLTSVCAWPGSCMLCAGLSTAVKWLLLATCGLEHAEFCPGEIIASSCRGNLPLLLYLVQEAA